MKIMIGDKVPFRAGLVGGSLLNVVVTFDVGGGWPLASPAFSSSFLKRVKMKIMIGDKVPFRAGLVGGSLLNVVVTFDVGHLVSSVMLAVVGTTVSYFVTKVLKGVFEGN